MPADPVARLAAVHAELAAVLPDARAIRDDGDRKQRLADGLIAAEAAAVKGTKAGCGAAVAALAAVQDEARQLEDVPGPSVRNCVRTAERAYQEAKDIHWPDASAVLTVRGFEAVAVSAAAPVEADATLLLSAPAAGQVTATVTLSGLSAADLAPGQAVSFTATVPAGATSLPLPLRFAAQALAADKAGRLGLSSPSGATLGSPAGFQFTLKANVGSKPTVTIAQGFDAVALDAALSITKTVAVRRDGGTGRELVVPARLSGKGGALASPVLPAAFLTGQDTAEFTVMFPPAVSALSRAAFAAAAAGPEPGRFDLDASGGTFRVGAVPGFGFAVTLPDGSHPNGSGLSGMNPDNTDTGVDKVDAIGAWRGAPVTCYTVFNWGHQGWDSFVASYTKAGWTPFRVVPILAQKGVVPVCTIPGLVVGGNDLQAAIRGDYDHFHQGCASWLAAQPWRTEVVGRISRECNDPNQPFYYGADLATKKLWLQAHERIVGIYKDALGGRFLFSWCVMKRADGWQDAYPSFCDIVDIDAYLNTPVVRTQADFDQHWGFVSPHIDWALARNKPVAFSEWAIKDVDQPLGIQLQHDRYAKLAAQHVLHHENYFNSTDHHQIFGGTSYPLSAQMYVKCYSGG